MVAPVMIGLILAALTPHSPDDLRIAAEAAFRDGVQQAAKAPDEARRCFICSATMYESLRKTGAANPDLFRNQGNAYLLADDLPNAILAYRRGLQLAPTDRELQHDLSYARRQVEFGSAGTFGRPPIEHRPPWLPRWPGLLFAIMLLSYASFWLALGRWWMVRRSRCLILGGSALILAIVFGSAFALETTALQRDLEAPPIVVAQDGVQLLRGNGTRYLPRYDTPVNRGVEGRLVYARGRWVQIELASGEIGWVPRSSVLVDK